MPTTDDTPTSTGEKRLLTRVSQAFWCTLDGENARFDPAEISIGGQPKREIAWLDELFLGGIRIRAGQTKPLTMLITGPPGSGKTTLALEMAYRLSKNSKQFTLYVSTESEANQLIENAKSFGYEDAGDYIIAFDRSERFHEKDPPRGAVAIWGTDQIKKWGTFSRVADAALQDLRSWLGNLPAEVVESMVGPPTPAHRAATIATDFSPPILIIDSLNILKQEEEAEEFFERFLTAASRGTQLVVFVLDSGGEEEKHKFWEYASDIVLRLGHVYNEEYHVRTLEIVKARYQPHVWGKHQLKIYPSFPSKPVPGHSDAITRKRAHPYRDEGGVFVFPSIHYYLSLYKRLGPTGELQFASTRPESLSELTKIPVHRCTAFIGCRGGHKSHLGYLHLLHRIIDEKERALVISLRDDEEMTRATMGIILEHEFPNERRDVADFEKSNHLEILYYHPGYITPEEFFHRVFISVHRLKHQGQEELTVLFNSLDQLSARFPLCAKEEIFVPGIINLLSGEKITSIFIAVEEAGQPEEQYGLLPMADLVFKFHRDVVDAGETVVLEIARVAGGQRAGSKGTLELMKDGLLRFSPIPVRTGPSQGNIAK